MGVMGILWILILVGMAIYLERAFGGMERIQLKAG